VHKRTQPLKELFGSIILGVNMYFEVVLEKQEDNGFTAYVPKLPGCISQGNSKKEAIKNIHEAIELYLEDLTKEEFKTLKKKVEIVKATVSVSG